MKEKVPGISKVQLVEPLKVKNFRLKDWLVSNRRAISGEFTFVSIAYGKNIILFSAKPNSLNKNLKRKVRDYQRPEHVTLNTKK